MDKAPDYTKIAPKEQENVLSGFWYMLLFMEAKADDTGNVLDKRSVEGYYALWNKVTGDEKEPIWKTRAKEAK